MTIVVLKFHFYVDERHEFRDFFLISFSLRDVVSVLFVKIN